MSAGNLLTVSQSEGKGMGRIRNKSSVLNTGRPAINLFSKLIDYGVFALPETRRKCIIYYSWFMNQTSELRLSTRSRSELGEAAAKWPK